MVKLISRFTVQKAVRFIGLCSFVIVFLATPLFAEQGSIVFSKGKLSISRDYGTTWEVVRDIKKVKLTKGMCIKLDRYASAGLLLPDGSQIRLHGGSLFCIKDMGPKAPQKKGKGGLLKLLQGKMWFRNKRMVPKPRFETPSVVASIRGTEVYIEVDKKNEQLVTLDGEVEIKGKNLPQRYRVKRGDVARLKDGKIIIEKVLRPEMLAQWLIVVPEIVGPADKNSRDTGVMLAKKAMYALETWDISRAEKLAKQAIKVSPKRATPHLAYSFILQAQGKFKKALKEARAATRLDSNSIPARLKVAELLLGMDELYQAKKIVKGLSKLSASSKEKFWQLLYLGYIALIERNPHKAKQLFSQALKISQDSPYSYLGLGLACCMGNECEKGIKYMEMASLTAPFWAWPHLYMGKALYEIAERDEAEVELKRAIQLDPNDPSPYLYLSVIYMDTHRPSLAISSLEKALKLNDNRLTFRGRFLLDEDRAVTNINLANSLAKLGLYEWADARGNIAVWRDPSSSGAYLFRAVKSIELSEKDATLLSDARKAELLSPPNSNTYTTYQQYESLLERPRTRKGVFLKGGSDDTYESTMYVTGGLPGLAFKVQGATLGTDGPNKNVPNDLRTGDIRIKKSLSSRSEIFIQTLLYHYKRGNLYSWLDKEAKVYPHVHGDFNLNLIGYHQRLRAGSDILVQGGFLRDRLVEDPDLTSITMDKKHSGGFGEVAWYFRKRSHRIIFGSRWEEYSNDNKKKYHSQYIADREYSDSERERRIELIDYFELFPNVFIIGDISYNYRDIEGIEEGRADREKLFPGVGFVIEKGKDILRGAWCESSDISTFTGTLLPTEIAGFKKMFGPNSGIDRQMWAMGWDRFWNKRIFSRIEVFKRKNNYFREGFFDGKDSWNREKIYGTRLSLDVMTSENIGVEFITSYKDFYFPEQRRRQDLQNSLKVTYVNPKGLRVQVGLLYMLQEKSGKWLNKDDEHIFVPSITVSKYLASNKGLVYFKALNIFDNEFRYIPENYLDITQAPWPKFYFEAGIKWEW